jgi:Protein of unknown function (DUF3108)
MISQPVFAAFVFSVSISVATAATGVAQAPPPATISAVPSSRVLPPPPTYAIPSEKFVYSVQWRFLNAGTSTVEIQRSPRGEQVTATADSAGFPDKIFHVHDLFNAEIDPHSFCTLHIAKHNEEGSHKRELTINLDYLHSKSQVDVKDLGSSDNKHSEFDIPPCVTDVVTGFFYVASLPLAPGFSQTFPVNDNGKTNDVRIDVEGRERVKGPMGEFQTLRVKVQPVAGPMNGKGVLWVWFTDDARHLPVQMKSKLGFATLLFQLQRVDRPTGAK